MKTKTIFLSLFLVLALIQGCSKSGGNSSGDVGTANASVRMVNASSAFASLDLISSGVTRASAVATGSASSYASVSAGAFPLTLELSGSGTPSAQSAILLSAGVPYTVVAYTAGQQLRSTAVTDNEAVPVSGNGKIRVLNLAQIDTGNVDVYVVPAGGALAAASTLVGNFGGTSGYFEISKGTYRIAVTGVGNKTDLRLDLPAVVVGDQQVLTLLLTSTAGGALVDGWLVAQQVAPLGAVSAQKNVSARVRVVASITGAAVQVVATVNGVALDASTLVSPAVDTYALVPAGALTTSVVVNGTTFPVLGLNAVAGADLTLLAVGTAVAPQFFLLSDDNRLPLNGTAKLRLVNGVNGPVGNIALTADATLVAQNVAFGTASAATTIVTTGNGTQLQVTGPGSASLSPANSLTLKSQGVYSVFMLGDTAAVVEIVRADR
jgi:hypothetical protein